MNEHKHIVFELIDRDTGRTIMMFKDKYTLDSYIQYEVPGKINWDVRVHHPMPDTHMPSREERIKKRRDNLIDGLLDG